MFRADSEHIHHRLLRIESVASSCRLRDVVPVRLLRGDGGGPRDASPGYAVLLVVFLAGACSSPSAVSPSSIGFSPPVRHNPPNEAADFAHPGATGGALWMGGSLGSRSGSAWSLR